MEWRDWSLFLTLVLLVQIWSVRGQDINPPPGSLPNCGATCLVQSLNSSSCAVFNFNQTCLCTDQRYQNTVQTCVLQACTVREALTTKNTTQITCGITPRDKSLQLYITTVTLGVVTALLVTARLLFRILVKKLYLSSDDWAILLALLVGLSGTVIISVGTVPSGAGRDIWTLQYDQITDFGRWFFFNEIQYFIVLALIKLSLLLFYLRIFPSRQMKILLWGTVVFNGLFGLGFTITALLECRPINYFWLQWDGQHRGQCININALAWANASISIALDIWMLAMPLSQLKTLQLHWKKKIGVALMFFVGTFVTIFSIIRLQSLIDFANSTNPTWDNWSINYWSTVEINVGIICSCMPSIRQILTWLFPVVFGGSTIRRGNDYPNYSNASLDYNNNGTRTTRSDRGTFSRMPGKDNSSAKNNKVSILSLGRSTQGPPSSTPGTTRDVKVASFIPLPKIKRAAPLINKNGNGEQRSFYIEDDELNETGSSVRMTEFSKVNKGSRIKKTGSWI